MAAEPVLLGSRDEVLEGCLHLPHLGWREQRWNPHEAMRCEAALDLRIGQPCTHRRQLRASSRGGGSRHRRHQPRRVRAAATALRRASQVPRQRPQPRSFPPAARRAGGRRRRRDRRAPAALALSRLNNQHAVGRLRLDDLPRMCQQARRRVDVEGHQRVAVPVRSNARPSESARVTRPRPTVAALTGWRPAAACRSGRWSCPAGRRPASG